MTIKISHGTRFEETGSHNGYGYATENMIASLGRLGYEVTQNDSSADVEIWFDQPHHWSFSEGVYRIGYHPWESTALLKGKSQKEDWLEKMNMCDEIWAPSPLIADWYKRYMGIKPPVYVYEHGVDPIWTPKKRELDGEFKFLHLGGEAARKGAKEAMQAIRLGFPKSKDVSLTMKMLQPGWKVNWSSQVNVVNCHMDITELISLYHGHHAYVYPSYGEGFGLTPLQALATGMPTITVPDWAPYSDFLSEDLNISAKLTRSPFPLIHPGMMFKPSVDSLIDSMRHTVDNYEAVHESHLKQVDEVLAKYNWDSLTRQAFESLEKRL